MPVWDMQFLLYQFTHPGLSRKRFLLKATVKQKFQGKFANSLKTYGRIVSLHRLWARRLFFQLQGITHHWHHCPSKL